MKGYKQTVRHYYKKVEYTTAGTYTLTIPSTVSCEVVLVGGGGGGAYSNSYGSWANAQNGGSAGKITGKCTLTAGNYTVVVGALGEGRYSTNGGGGATSSALAGGNTTFNGNIAKGGGGAYTHTGYFDSQGSPGSAGTFTVKTSGLTGSNGASGSTTGRYNNYGAGGSGNGGSNTGNNGKSGYASFLFESTSSDYTYYVDIDTFSLNKQTVRKYYKYKAPASGYRELTYIKSDGNQYIDLGISLGSSVMKVDMDFAYASGSTKWLTGTGTNLGSAGQGVAFGVYGGTWSVIEPGSSYNQFGTVTTNRVQFQWTINGNTSTVTGYASNNVTSSGHFGTSCPWRNYNINVFVGLTSDTSERFIGTLYSYTLTIDNVIVRKLVPCERLSDNTYGLYDTKNNVFYRNSGSGSFTKGNYIIENGTSSNYDFYEDVYVYKAFNV